MNSLELFNDKYQQETLAFEDMKWFINYLHEKYDPSRLLHLVIPIRMRFPLFFISLTRRAKKPNK